MSPSPHNVDEQPEFVEMKPLTFSNETAVAVNQAFTAETDAATEAEMAICSEKIQNLQRQLLEEQLLPGIEPGLPEASASERAFSSCPEPSMFTASYGNENDEELMEDVPQVPMQSVKMEVTQTPSVNPEALVTRAFADLLHIDASFNSFAEFDEAFRNWKEGGHHPMRIASSEALKDPSGRVDETFRYKHAVYHCAHYGKPRCRGSGARPNRNYLPCGCPAMFRLNFNYFERKLRVTSMNVEHVGHPLTYEHYKAVCSNVRAARKSRPNVQPWTPSSSSTASPSSSYTGTPLSVKQNTDDSPASTPSRLTMIRSDDYCKKRTEEYDEEWTLNVKRERTEDNQSTSRSGSQTRVPAGNHDERYDDVARHEYGDTVIDVPALPGLAKMEVGATFKNWQEFESSFEHWKSVGMHPMRVASSETMKDLNGMPNPVYKYKYVVYHCAHYGIPRIRGNGSRPNQSYLPCGCGSMLRLAYNFVDQTLRVNAVVPEHKGHPRDRKFFEKIMAKIRSSRGRHSTASRINSATSSPLAPFRVSLPPPGTPAGGFDVNQLLAMLSNQNQMAMQLLQSSQQSGSSINVSSILNGVGSLPALDMPILQQQQPDLSQPVELAGLSKPIAESSLENGAITNHLNERTNM